MRTSRPHIQNQTLPHLRALQSLRGVAALLVLAFHIAGVQRLHIAPDAEAELALLSGIWDRGYMGVDLFFVISGFVMVYVTRGLNSGSAKSSAYTLKQVGRFLYARMTRIYPLWWVFSGLMALYFWIAYHVPADPYRISGAGEVVPYLAKSFLLIPQHHLPVLSVGWTLIHEMYFYIVFAGILLLPKRALPLALAAWAACIALAFYAGLTSSSQSIAQSFPEVLFSLLSLEFIGGAFVGYLVTRGTTRAAGLCAIAGAILIVVGCLVFTSAEGTLGLWGRVAVFAVPCSLLVYGLTGLETRGHFHMPDWIVQIGNWSYSLYLSHILVLSGIVMILEKLVPVLPKSLGNVVSLGAPGPIDNLVFAAMGGLGCIVFAGLSYKFIERPLLRISRRILKKEMV
ncbi:MAG: hypothetical protein COA69_10315 [Robiginitomaculum sp.]|nr:MAG: hypothetical protein COA69_10315 [Robiginitomaculum sp.]